MSFSILNEDCRITLDREEVTYDYILASPPDFLEIGLTAKDQAPYVEFLTEVYAKFRPRKGLVSLLMTDKKKDNRIYTKHIINIEVMRSLGWDVISEKIWLRTLKSNAYETTFSFVLTFSKGAYKQNRHPDFQPDVFHVKRDPGIKKYAHRHIGMNSFPAELGRRFVLNYTDEGDTVMDPFMGIGGSALSAVQCKRNVVGCELDTETHRLCVERVQEEVDHPSQSPDVMDILADLFMPTEDAEEDSE